MEESLEWVVMATLPRPDQSHRLTKSIRCQVLTEAETAIILATRGRELGDLTPKSTGELLKRYRVIANCLSAGATQVAEDYHGSWTLLWEHIEDPHIYQFKHKRVGKEVIDVALASTSDGKILSFEFPSRRPRNEPYNSQILGWDHSTSRLFGCYSTSSSTKQHFWIFDFLELLEPKLGCIPFSLSRDFDLKVCFLPDLKGFEIHFHKQSLSLVYFDNLNWLTIGIVWYDQSARQYCTSSEIRLPDKQFGPARTSYSELDLGLKLDFNKDLTRMLSIYWNIRPIDLILSVCLSFTSLDFGGKSSQLLSQHVYIPKLCWKFREGVDSCDLGILPFNEFTIMLATFNRNILENFRKNPVSSMTYVHLSKSGRMSLVEVRAHHRDWLPIGGSRQLKFRDRIQQQQYFLAELPNTFWPNKRFCVFRLAFKFE